MVSVSPSSFSASTATSFSAAASSPLSATASFAFSAATPLLLSTPAPLPLPTPLLPAAAVIWSTGAQVPGVLLSGVDREQHEEADATFRCEEGAGHGEGAERGGGREGRENINTI